MGFVFDIFVQNVWGVMDFQEEIVECVDFKLQLFGLFNLFCLIYLCLCFIVIVSCDCMMMLVLIFVVGELLVELILQGVKVCKFDVVCFVKGLMIYMIELVNIFVLLFEQQVKDIMQEVVDCLVVIIDDIELIWEYQCFGVIQGRVIDFDGMIVFYNWFIEMGVIEFVEINFEFMIVIMDVCKKFCDLKCQMQKVGKGIWGLGFYVVGIVDDFFFDFVVNYLNYKEMKFNMLCFDMLENIEGYFFIEIEGVILINYCGMDDGMMLVFGFGKVCFFLVGMCDVFQVGWVFVEEMKDYYNQCGRLIYGIIELDFSVKQFWDCVEFYFYFLYICMCLEMFIFGKVF